MKRRPLIWRILLCLPSFEGELFTQILAVCIYWWILPSYTATAGGTPTQEDKCPCRPFLKHPPLPVPSWRLASRKIQCRVLLLRPQARLDHPPHPLVRFVLTALRKSEFQVIIIMPSKTENRTSNLYSYYLQGGRCTRRCVATCSAARVCPPRPWSARRPPRWPASGARGEPAPRAGGRSGKSTLSTCD